ncbi:macro domain-containing protein [Tenacibaculum aiptasiae]|uniref:macro domain-containing protein n=1 Tax=Tenacibaculum aiptasiae TaxID=426481 RepID=UPI003B5BF4BD
MEIIKELITQKYNVILLILGVILILVSFFGEINFSEFEFKISEKPQYVLIVFGGMLIFLSVVFTVIQENIFIKPSEKARIEKVKKGLYSVIFDKSKINLKYGRIEECDCEYDDTAIVLPANEFFDDECIRDKKSALGSFIQKHFPNQEDKFEELIQVELQKMEGKDVEKEEGKFQKSYGIGTCLFFKKPLNSKYNIIISSVTRKRKGIGLHSNISFLMQAINNIHLLALDKRISKIKTPLLGAGHGGVNNKISLFAIVLGFSQFLMKKQNKEVTIIIFRKKEEAKADIVKKDIYKILKYAIGLSS